MAYLWLDAQAHAAAREGPGAERLLSYLTCARGPPAAPRPPRPPAGLPAPRGPSLPPPPTLPPPPARSHQIRTDTTPVYGDGFRAALALFQARGLRPLFDHALAHRAWPAGWGA